jgi:hypothetical protein
MANKIEAPISPTQTGENQNNTEPNHSRHIGRKLAYGGIALGIGLGGITLADGAAHIGDDIHEIVDIAKEQIDKTGGVVWKDSKLEISGEIQLVKVTEPKLLDSIIGNEFPNLDSENLNPSLKQSLFQKIIEINANNQLLKKSEKKDNEGKVIETKFSGVVMLPKEVEEIQNIFKEVKEEVFTPDDKGKEDESTKADNSNETQVLNGAGFTTENEVHKAKAGGSYWQIAYDLCKANGINPDKNLAIVLDVSNYIYRILNNSKELMADQDYTAPKDLKSYIDFNNIPTEPVEETTNN